MKLDVRSVLLLLHPDGRQVLLLRRSSDKRLFPGLITGIGGKVELERREGEDLVGAALRELGEETRIELDVVQKPRLRLSTLLTRGDEQVVLLWFTARLAHVPKDLSSPDGQLQFFEIARLPLKEMIPTARAAIPFVLSLPEEVEGVNGVFEGDSLRLITNRS